MHYYLENKIRFPFQAKCLAGRLAAQERRKRRGRAHSAPDDACKHDMLALVGWQGRKIAVPLAQLTAVDPDESTDEAISDWHYSVAQGYCL